MPKSLPPDVDTLSGRRSQPKLTREISKQCAAVQPLFGLASLLGPDGPVVSFQGGQSAKIEFFGFIGLCCLVAVGGFSALVGYLDNVIEYGHKYLTTAAIVLVQTA